MNKNKKYRESEKRYRKNMTDEQKQKQRDYQKEYRKNITDEQQQRYREAVKKSSKKNIWKNIEKLKSDIEKT